MKERSAALKTARKSFNASRNTNTSNILRVPETPPLDNVSLLPTYQSMI